MSRQTPNRGIRYPDFPDLATPQAMQRMAEDLDVAATVTDGKRSAAIKRPRARVHRSAGTQNITKTTWTQLTGFNVVDYDTSGFANLGVNNDRLTSPFAGLLLLKGSFDVPPPGGVDPDTARLAIAKNGATNGSADFVQKPLWTHNSSSYDGDCTALLSAAVNDFFVLWVYWNGTPAGPATFGFQSLSVTLIATP